LKSPLSEEQFQEFGKATSETEENIPHPGLIGVNGISRDKNRLFISFYDSYSDYFREARFIRQMPHVNVNGIESFLVDLTEETVGVGVLSLSDIADSLLHRLKKKDRQR
jgi:hypothetical protein